MGERQTNLSEPISVMGLYAAERAQDPQPGETHPPHLDEIPVKRVTDALAAAKQLPVFVRPVQPKKAA